MKYVKFLDFFLIESFVFIDLTERERKREGFKQLMYSKVGDNDCLFVQLRCAVYTRMYIDLLCIVPYFSVSC